jgi:hypothetical protein
MDFARRKNCRNCGGHQDTIARILSAWEFALAAYGPFLFGKLSTADCICAGGIAFPYGVDVPASSGSYMEQMMALPAM